MAMYAKIFRDVLFSSLTESQPIEVRGVFFMLLAAADKDGKILGVDSAIARVINVPLGLFQGAVEALMAPDPQSKPDEFQGRRLMRLEGGVGLLITKYREYSGIKTDDERRAYFAQKQAEYRARKEAREQMPDGSKIPKVPPVSKYHPDSMAVLAALNLVSGRNYRAIEVNLKPISARLSEPGITKEGVIKMVETQGANWKGSDMVKYLRPETLFAPTKFESYYAARNEAVVGQEGSHFKEIRENLELPLVTIEQFTAKMEALKAKQRNPYEPIPPRPAGEA